MKVTYSKFPAAAHPGNTTALWGNPPQRAVTSRAG